MGSGTGQRKYHFNDTAQRVWRVHLLGPESAWSTCSHPACTHSSKTACVICTTTTPAQAWTSVEAKQGSSLGTMITPSDHGSFFHPDYTVGTGFTPVPALRLVDFAKCVTTDGELALASPCPEGIAIGLSCLSNSSLKKMIEQHSAEIKKRLAKAWCCRVNP